MVRYAPKVPGDPIFIHRGLYTKAGVHTNVEIEKGHIYTMNADGHLIVPTVTSNTADLNNGMFQAMADSAAGGTSETAGTRRVQVAVRPSFILMKAPADATVGDRVKLAATTTVDGDKTEVLTGTDVLPDDYLGSIYEIYTRPSADSTARKDKTADDDLIVVNTGVPA